MSEEAVLYKIVGESEFKARHAEPMLYRYALTIYLRNQITVTTFVTGTADYKMLCQAIEKRHHRGLLRHPKATVVISGMPRDILVCLDDVVALSCEFQDSY